jgi:peptide/nickel transport system permease protein
MVKPTLRFDLALKQFEMAPKSGQVMTIAGIVICASLASLVFFGENLVPYGPQQMVAKILLPPSSEYLMGTDMLGRDVFSRVICGTKWSVSVSFIAVSMSMLIGTSLGAFSGYFGGGLDRLLMVGMDALYIFPSFVLAVLIAAVMGAGIGTSSLAVAIVLIPTFFRIIRSVTLSIKESGFIEGERAIGASGPYIILNHIAPFYLSSLFVLISLGAAQAILITSGLGFLGLGIPPPNPEWGTDLAAGRMFLMQGAWWMTVFPAIMIFLAVLGFNLLSEGLDAVLNPQIRKL